MLGFLAKATLHSKVIVKAASVLQMKFLTKVAYQSEIPFKITAEIKFAKQLRAKTPANSASLVERRIFIKSTQLCQIPKLAEIFYKIAKNFS